MILVLSVLLKAVGYLPRREIAALVRHALSLLATKVEGDATNVIEHDGEVIFFNALDGLLAKVEAGPSTPAAINPAPSQPATPAQSPPSA